MIPVLIRAAQDLFSFDFLFCTHDGPVEWGKAGRITDMGHAVYAGDGSDQHQPAVSPFKTEEEVWAFDAVNEYGLPGADDLVREYEQSLNSWRAANPNQLVTGGYYQTIVSGAITAFGWDMLLTAASDPARMERVLRFVLQAHAFPYGGMGKDQCRSHNPARRFRLDLRPVHEP